MKVASLGSGSQGNSLYVEAEETRVLVDAGFSGVEIERRLGEIGVAPAQIDALVVTHEHRDHTAGIGVAARRWGWPLHMSPQALRECRNLLSGGERVRTFESGTSFPIGALRIHPFRTCHDAASPLAVSLRAERSGLKVGVATDLGRPTGPVRHALAGSHFLVLEANHDEVLLREGPYPWPVKERIGGSRGHLSNRLAAELARDLLHPDLRGLLLAHLSERCNRPELARRTVAEALDGTSFRGMLAVARQEGPTPLYDLRELLRDRRRPQLDLFGEPVGSTGP